MIVKIVTSINWVVEKTNCVPPFKDSEGIYHLFLVNTILFYVSSKQVVIISYTESKTKKRKKQKRRTEKEEIHIVL